MKRSASNPPLNFTAASVASIKPQDKRVTYRDSQIRELGLQVNPGGYRSYFWYGKVRGRPTWETIGSAETTSVAQARDKARALTGKLTAWKLKDYEGPNPFEKIDRATTLGALIENYIVRKVRVDAKRPEHAEKQIRWATDRYLGGWKSKRLADIRRKDVLNLRDDLGESAGHTMANRMIEIIRALFNWAHDKEIFDGENPAARIDKFAEKKRTRYLQPDELAKLERALASEPNPDLVDFVRLSLHLGARKSDVLGMQWRDLALTSEGPLWNVPETTKSGKTYVIPLTPEAGAILTRRLGACGDGNPWVFPSRGRTGHVVDLKGCWAKLLKRAGLAGTDLRQHDLRRTFASYQAGLGASLATIGQSLGHSDIASTQIYARLGIGPVRESIMAATRVMQAAAAAIPSTPRVTPRRQLKAAGRE